MTTTRLVATRRSLRPPKRVLVIEDDEAFRNCMVLALRKRGFLVYAEPDGESALARLAEMPFDVIVLDLLLPRLTGMELLRAVRARLERVPPVVVVSGLRVAQSQEPYLRSCLGVRAVLSKPVGLRAFVAAVDAVLARAEPARVSPPVGGGVVSPPEGFRILHQGFDEVLATAQAALPEVRLLVRSAPSTRTLEDGLLEAPEVLLLCALGNGERAAATTARVRASFSSRFLVLAAGDTPARTRVLDAGADAFFALPHEAPRLFECLRAHSAGRRHLRARFHGPIEVVAGPAVIHAEGVNLSESGILVTMGACLATGQLVRLRLRLPDGGPGIELEAYPVRVETAPSARCWHIAFELAGVTAALRNRLRTYVRDVLRLSSYQPVGAILDGG